MSRLARLVGLLLMLGLALSLRAPLPDLFPATSTLTPPGELGELNRV